MFGHQVLKHSADRGIQVVAELPGERPSGLGWLADGRLLVVAMKQRALLRLEADGGLSVHADLRDWCRGFPNDMVVAADGTAYVGDSGLPEFGQPGQRQPGQLLRVAPNGGVSVAADDLVVPNGCVVTDDGRRMLLVEAHAGRIVSFAVGTDGSLSERRLFAEVPAARPGEHVHPDGMCLDTDGAVWVCDVAGRRVLRILTDGSIDDDIAFHTRTPVACVLGGPDRRTLYICASGGGGADILEHTTAGTIISTRVAVPGAGRP